MKAKTIDFKSKIHIGNAIRHADTIGLVMFHKDGGEIFEETIAEVLPAT